MDLPPQLANEVREGRAILFLGAGASKGARRRDSEGPPDGQQLGRLLADRFLGGRHRDEPLSWIAELATSESSVAAVQDYIADQYRALEPAEFHRLIPTFKWRAIATTNYDTLVEDVYAQERHRLQSVVPFVSDRDRIDDKLRASDSVALLKLHGCITRTHEPDVQLILTADQYVAHSRGRERVFDLLREWAHENPIVFAGYQLQDPDLRKLLLELISSEQYRPRYYLVRPSASQEEVRFWESKRITVLDGTFEEFLIALDAKIPREHRRLFTLVPNDHPFRRRFAVAEDLGSSLLEVLDNDLEYVHPNIAVERGTPSAFYRGFNLGWYPIERDLDVKRELAQQLMLELVLTKDVDRPTTVEFYVIKAEAGAGKSVFLRRLAWDAAREADAICFYARSGGRLEYDALTELHRVTKQRLFLFVDDATDHSPALEKMLGKARRNKLPLTIIAAERINEWNMAGDRLDPFVTGTFQLPYLSTSEINGLLALLEQHGSLGFLKSRTPEQRIADITKRAGRQLLVALHEATSGKPFEEIIADEFSEIKPRLAQEIYLSVCVLHRLNIPLRAGIVSRVYDVPFERFREQFLAPLEHVVHVEQHGASRDYHYTARHAEIASIVFDRVLSSTEDRYGHYVKLIGAMNQAYSSDRDAFRALMRGRVLLDLFPDHDAVLEIFRVAERVAYKDAYLMHQRGLYEMHRPNGSLDEALRFLRLAHDLNERDTSVLHSMAELERKRSESARSQFERDKLRSDATAIAVRLMSDERSRPAARHTLIKIAIDKLRDALAYDQSSQTEIDAAVQEVERQLESGLQENPTDSYLLSSEAEYSALLRDHERAFRALSAAFQANRRNALVATRLSKAYQARGDREAAMEVLRGTLDANPGDRQAHYQLARLLMEESPMECDALLYHLRRGFTPGDRNFDAQFWYARFAFESKQPEQVREAKELFSRLRSAPLPMPYEEKVRVRVVSKDAVGNPKVFTGTVVRKEVTFGFIQMDGSAQWIFMHRDDLTLGRWEELSVGRRAAFELGFSFYGPKAVGGEVLS